MSYQDVLNSTFLSRFLAKLVNDGMQRSPLRTCTERSLWTVIVCPVTIFIGGDFTSLHVYTCFDRATPVEEVSAGAHYQEIGNKQRLSCGGSHWDDHAENQFLRQLINWKPLQYFVSHCRSKELILRFTSFVAVVGLATDVLVIPYR